MLSPFWHAAGWALGAASAALGEKAAMACTVAVESVIGEHYQQQAEALAETNEQELLEKVTRFRDDELEHHDTGLEHGAEDAPAYRALYHGIRGITKLAIHLSSRI